MDEKFWHITQRYIVSETQNHDIKQVCKNKIKVYLNQYQNITFKEGKDSGRVQKQAEKKQTNTGRQPRGVEISRERVP